MPRLARLAPLIGLALAAVLPGALPATAGDEFVVNTYRGAWQNDPDVATLKDGSFVVVWDSFHFDGENDYYYIAAQRFAPDGRKLGTEFVVDGDLPGHSRFPAVTALDDGGFAVAWENSLGSVLNETDAYARAFGAKGKPRGRSARVHDRDDDSQYAADVAPTADGGFAVTFTSYEGASVSKQDEVYLQRFTAAGARRGGRIKVNQLTRFDQQTSRLARLGNGRLVVIWDSEYAGPSSTHQVRGRIFGTTGSPVTPEFVVSDSNAGYSSAIDFTETSIAVAALPGNRFVATWQETVLHEDSDTTFEIRGQRFDAGAHKVGREFIVRSGSDGVARHSEIAALRTGGFVVAWDVPGPDFAFAEARARFFDAGGVGGAPFRLNQAWNRSDQEYPALAVGKDGRLFAVFESEYLDGDDDGIAGRFFVLRD